MRRCYLILVGLLCLLACTEQRWQEYGSEVEPDLKPTIRLATFGALCTEQPREVPPTLVLSGYVISSDRANNFYRSLVLDDGTGAIEILTGMYDLHNSYPLGQRIVVVAGGLWADRRNGVVRLGVRRGAESQLDYMEHRAVADRYLYRMSQRSLPVPASLTPAEFGEGWLGRLVRVDGLMLSPAVDTTWAVSVVHSSSGRPESVALKFKTLQNDSLYVYTSGYASFASSYVPLREVSLVGVLYQGQVEGRKVYQLRLRDEKDIQMD